jgi:hypothetical protein
MLVQMFRRLLSPNTFKIRKLILLAAEIILVSQPPYNNLTHHYIIYV